MAGQPTSVRFNDRTGEAIETFAEREGVSKTEAIEQLVQTGLREQNHPVASRLKGRVADWISLLGISAILVTIAGATTGVFAFSRAALFAVTAVIFAVGLLAVFEVVRFLDGTSPVGDHVRRLWGEWV